MMPLPCASASSRSDLPCHCLCFLQHRFPYPDVVVPPPRQRGARDLDRPLHDFLVQFARTSGSRYACSFSSSLQQQDRMPGGHAAKHLRIAHGEARGVAIGSTQRIGPNASLGSLFHQGHMFFPGLGLTHRLAQVVIHQLAATGFRQTRHQAVFAARHRGRRRSEWCPCPAR